MSAEIHNSKSRSDLLIDMIKILHDGEQFEAVKKLFRRSQETQVHLFNIVSPAIVDFVMNSTKKYHCTYDINPHYFLANKESIYFMNLKLLV